MVVTPRIHWPDDAVPLTGILGKSGHWSPDHRPHPLWTGSRRQTARTFAKPLPRLGTHLDANRVSYGLVLGL